MINKPIFNMIGNPELSNMTIIHPQRKSISQVKAQLLNPATTSHFQMSVSFQDSRFNRFKQEMSR